MNSEDERRCGDKVAISNELTRFPSNLNSPILKDSFGVMMTTITRIIFGVLTIVALSGCQTTTSVDSKYTGLFSTFDSAPEKTKTLVNRGELEDAAEIYQEHKESFDNPESKAIVEDLKNRVLSELRESVQEMKNVGQTGEFRSDNRKIAQAKSLTDSYSDYKEILGLEDEANELRSLLKKASERTAEILRNESRQYVLDGVRPTYARLSAFRV